MASVFKIVHGSVCCVFSYPVQMQLYVVLYNITYRVLLPSINYKYISAVYYFSCRVKRWERTEHERH